jgi:OHCU decarboxylase
MDKATFMSTYGTVYEHSPWVAEALWQRGVRPEHDDPGYLADELAEIVLNADYEQLLALVCAHPDLAGRAAVAGELTEGSMQEQQAAGLDRCSPEEFERFQNLNSRYRTRFGFPFIIAVGGLNRTGILAEFEKRIANDPETEFQTALKQINRIARLRLNAL